MLDSQRPPKRVRTRGGLTNRAPLKSVPSRSTMPPANVDINDTQATPMGISVKIQMHLTTQKTESVNGQMSPM